jgi:hypothetical protein
MFAKPITVLLALLGFCTSPCMSANEVSQSTVPVSTISDMQPVPGNANLLVSQVPALDPDLRQRACNISTHAQRISSMFRRKATAC